MQADQITDYLKRLTPHARSNLLSELERLEVCGIEMPGADEILETLRAEFRKTGQTPNQTGNPQRYFFAPLEPYLIDSDPEHPNSGRISRGSLTPVWEWISHDLLPTMARDYAAKINDLMATDRQQEARRVTSTFQTKIVKSLENTLASPDATAQLRIKLATYTASHSIFSDLIKMTCALRARDALAKFESALPHKISSFDDDRVTAMTDLLAGLGKTHGDALPFALTLIANRLKKPWQLIRLATKAARTKEATAVAATPYAIAVSMALDRLEDKKLALRLALKNERVTVAKQLLKDIYDTEYALQVRIDQLDQSDWGARLRKIMNAITALVEAELKRFPPDVGHVLGSRRLRSHDSLAGRLTYLAWKGRDAVHDGAEFCKKLIGQT